jgi:hypothetical protein
MKAIARNQTLKNCSLSFDEEEREVLNLVEGNFFVPERLKIQLIPFEAEAPA